MATFRAILNEVRAHPAPLLPPGIARSEELTAKIADLQLHPTLEAGLHLLNLDLPSAHFLCRHMQSAPAFEGMYLHGILHRIEGDYDNARAWYSDVKESEVYQKVWGKDGKTFKEVKEVKEDKTNKDLDAGQKFLNKVQAFKESEGKEGSEQDLLSESKREFDLVMEYCEKKFGTEKMVDASSAWVKNSDEIRQMGEDQVSGDSGQRKF